MEIFCACNIINIIYIYILSVCHIRLKTRTSLLSNWSTKVHLLDEHDSHSTHFISPLLHDSNRFSRSDHKESRRFTCTQAYTVNWPTLPPLNIYKNYFSLLFRVKDINIALKIKIFFFFPPFPFLRYLENIRKISIGFYF